MANFFSKLFSFTKGGSSNPETLLKSVLDGLIEKGGFELIYDIEKTEDGYYVNLSGKDARLLTHKDGLFLEGFHFFLKRLLQHKFPDSKYDISVDADGFLEASAQELQGLAERLKNLVLKKGQPAYVRALTPRDRKVVHRYLADDERVRSQSVGEGFCKKIKISLVRSNKHSSLNDETSEETFA